MMVVKYGHKRKIPNHLLEKKEITKVIIVSYIIQQPTICCTWFYRTWKECQYKYRYGNKQKNKPFIDPYENAKNDSINELLKMNTAVGRIRKNEDAPAKNTLLNNRNVCVPPLLLRLKTTKSFSIPFLRFKLFLRLSDPFLSIRQLKQKPQRFFSTRRCSETFMLAFKSNTFKWIHLLHYY